MLNVDFNKLASLINANVQGANATVNNAEDAKFDSSITVEASKIFAVCEFLKTNKEMPFNSLQCISGVDWVEFMEVCYMLAHFDTTNPREFILKVKVTDRVAPAVDSVVKVWAAANFQEREVYDMFGIKFNNHPDMRRILCPDDWQGWPLRKDYIAQKDYNGMAVYPDNKMNFEDREFIVRQDMIKKAQLAASSN
ncbi:NADH-quinone oxidoreductase subunit C [Peredibacter sp. HCB2-198]|uniref:NADH-quinone oxidoreductase subunit C n=1 Tax=Peredibacter sp. HCB2-198 TaxID=3383025 RepID=UPI0038B5D606